MILAELSYPRLGEITNIEYLQLISEKAERATATSGFVNGTQYLVNVSVFVVSVCVFYYAVGVVKKQTEKYSFGLYKFCSADSLFHAGFNYFHSDLYPLCPLGDSRGHFGSLYGRYAGKLKRKN